MIGWWRLALYAIWKLPFKLLLSILFLVSRTSILQYPNTILDLSRKLVVTIEGRQVLRGASSPTEYKAKLKCDGVWPESGRSRCPSLHLPEYYIVLTNHFHLVGEQHRASYSWDYFHVHLYDQLCGICRRWHLLLWGLLRGSDKLCGRCHQDGQCGSKSLRLVWIQLIR